MMADFYRNAAALFDEFKKRELHYLSIERSSYNTLNWKNETSRSTEDYLRKITERERETEKNYRAIMRNMEELDKHTDQMSLKLEKLNVLRNIAVSSYNSSWNSTKDTFDGTPHSYLSNVPPSTLLSNAPVNTFPQRTFEYTPNEFSNAMSKDIYTNLQYPVSHPEEQLFKLNSDSKEIQTEHVFCEHCHYPFTMRSNVTIASASQQSSVLNRTNNLEFVTNKVAHSSLCTDTSPEASTPSINTALYKGDNEFKQDALKESSGISNERPVPEKNSHVLQDTLVDRTDISRENFIPDAKDNAVGDFVRENKEQCTDIKEDALVSCESNENVIVSKSDDESINHEFDFLESDKMRNSKRKTSQPVVQIPRSPPETKTLSSDKENEKGILKNASSSLEEDPPIDTSMHLQVNQASGKNLADNVERNESIKSASDIKSVSSVSADYPSHVPFENTSIASESDSFSDKETPLTATAAYQAMLGNVTSSKVMERRQEISDSESEDEIENALATTVRKSSSISLSATTSHVQKIEDKKEKVPEAKSKKETKSQGAIFPGKPQNKLTKKTRKVLGLETSSGSEMELEVKSAPSKKDEDSDEFDFYD